MQYLTILLATATAVAALDCESGNTYRGHCCPGTLFVNDGQGTCCVGDASEALYYNAGFSSCTAGTAVPVTSFDSKGNSAGTPATATASGTGTASAPAASATTEQIFSILPFSVPSSSGAPSTSGSSLAASSSSMPPSGAAMSTTATSDDLASGMPASTAASSAAAASQPASSTGGVEPMVTAAPFGLVLAALGAVVLA